MSTKQAILEQIDTVPSLPPAATQAIQLLQDDNMNIADLVSVIQHDPAITANLLRICNSVLVRGRSGIGSVRDAVVRLGARRTLELIMTDSIGPLTRRKVKGYDLPAGQLWEHSVAVAIGTQKLAHALDLAIQPNAYTGALLHDVGKCVLGTFLELEVQPVIDYATQAHIPFEEAERHILGVDHAEVGAALLRLWNVPPDIVEIVRWHHEPENATDFTESVCLVHTADLLAMEAGIGTGIDGLNYRPSQAVTERLNLNVHILESVLCEVLTELADVKKMFNGKDGR